MKTIADPILFGKNVFNEAVMKQYLTKEAFNSVMNAINKGNENR